MLKIPGTRHDLLRGRLSYAIDDHVHIPESVYEELQRKYDCTGALATILHLESKGETLLGRKSTTGTALLSPPLVVKGEGVLASFGFVDTSDSLKDERRLRVQDHLSVHTKSHPCEKLPSRITLKL